MYFSGFKFYYLFFNFIKFRLGSFFDFIKVLIYVYGREEGDKIYIFLVA